MSSFSHSDMVSGDADPGLSMGDRTVFVPCSGGCGWHVPVQADDKRILSGGVLCLDCQAGSRPYKLVKCACGETASQVFEGEVGWDSGPVPCDHHSRSN